MARSLNKVELIGNMTRDPELRYTPAGAAVCTFGLATNRQWTTESGEKKEDAEFHRIVAWNKLAELCAQLLAKGRKVYVEGRLQTRRWTGSDGQERYTTEVVINDMIILDSRGASGGEEFNVPEGPGEETSAQDEKSSEKLAAATKLKDDTKMQSTKKPKDGKVTAPKSPQDKVKEEDGDDIPF